MRQKNKLSICAIFRNEAPYFKEWIEYHLLVGVDHFFLYNNGSTDHFEQELAPYIQARRVTLIDWPNQKPEEWKDKPWAWVYSTQKAAYEHAIWQAKGHFRWMAAIDLDEFLVPIQADFVPEVLEKYPDAPGFEGYWQVHGTSWLEKLPEKQLLIEALQTRMFLTYPLNWQVKTILCPISYQSFSWPPHRCEFVGGQTAFKLDRSELVINHYINRCEDYFFSHKIKNKEDMDNVKLGRADIVAMLSLGNDEEDREGAIRRFVPKLRKKIFS